MDWLDIARKETGVAQLPAGQSNARIEEYHRSLNEKDKGWDDKVPWCSSFVNWCFARAGIAGTGSALARSWLDWGQPLSAPTPGCIVVLSREDPDSWTGHVGFFLRADAGHVYLLGGNQLAQVREHFYPRSAVLGYRWPPPPARGPTAGPLAAMIIIRPIVEADIPGVHHALDLVCRERIYLAMLEAPSPEKVHSFVTDNLKHGVPQFVAVEDGRVVGWCDAVPGDENLGTAHVGRLGMGVIHTHRGRGLGRRLAEATLRRARERGFKKIVLCVYSSNLAAIALYENLGFVEVGRDLRGHVVDEICDDVVHMVLQFGPPGPGR